MQTKELDIFSQGLLTLLNVGGPKMHCRLIEQCIKLFTELLEVIRTNGFEVVLNFSFSKYA